MPRVRGGLQRLSIMGRILLWLVLIPISCEYAARNRWSRLCSLSQNVGVIMTMTFL